MLLLTQPATADAMAGASGNHYALPYGEELSSQRSAEPQSRSSSANSREALAHGAPVTIALAPAEATIPSGQSIAYTVVATDALDVSWSATATATFSIDSGAGGSWTANLYTAAKDGTWTVTADYEGLTDNASLSVTNVPPTADAGGPYAGTAGSSVSFAASASDPGGGPFIYSWDMDNDGQFDDASGPSPSYIWTEARTHIVRVQVADSGLLTDTDTAQVTIGPADLSYVTLSPQSTAIQAGQAQLYTVEAFDQYDNSRGDVSPASSFEILEPGHGGSWTDNVYTSANYGDWTVRATYVETISVQDTASLTVLSPDLHLVKTADQQSVEAGDLLTYTLTYSNTGNQAATGVVITDTLDANVTYVSASPEPNGEVAGSYFWLFSALPVDGRDQITVTVSDKRPLTNGTRLTNTAWIDSNQTEPL